MSHEATSGNVSQYWQPTGTTASNRTSNQHTWKKGIDQMSAQELADYLAGKAGSSSSSSLTPFGSGGEVSSYIEKLMRGNQEELDKAYGPDSTVEDLINHIDTLLKTPSSSSTSSVSSSVSEKERNIFSTGFSFLPG